MIRNVVSVKLRPDADQALVDTLVGEFAALDLPGTVAYTIGRDLGLRAGGWSLAIVADFVDAAAYQAYDLDPGHNRLRDQLAGQSEQICRVQFVVD